MRPTISFTVCRRLTVWLICGFLGIAMPGLAQKRLSPGRAGSGDMVAARKLASDSVYFDVEKDLSEQLVPFDSIVALAYRHSPILHQEDAIVDGQLATYRYTKTIFLQFVFPFANYATGTNTTNNLMVIPDGLGGLVQNTQGWRVGANIQIPLSHILGRKNQIRSAHAQYKAAVAHRDLARQQLRRELIQVYQDLLVSQKVLRIQIKNMQNATVSYNLAEMDMKEGGKVSPLNFAQVSNLYAQTLAGVEQQRGLFFQHFYTLEAIVGVPLIELKK